MNLATSLQLHTATLRRENRSPRTIDFYTGWLTKLDTFINHKPIESITLDDLRAWIDSLIDHGLAPSTVRGAGITIKVHWTWCLRERLIRRNPSKRLEIPDREKRTPDVLTTSDVLTAINDVTAHSHHRVRDTALIVFMVETGVRRNELLALTPGDVHLHEHYAVVVCGKGKKDRLTFFGEATERTLTEWLATRPTTSDLWGLSASGLVSLLRRVGARTGLKLHPHRLRRTSATLRAAKGIPASALQSSFGWERIETANAYVAAAEVQAAAARSNPLDGVQLPNMPPPAT